MAAGKSPQPRVAVITGGGSGIGLALGHVFAGAGFSVVISGRDQQRLKAAVEELKKSHVAIMALPCDVTDSGSVDDLFIKIREQYSGIDVLVNNAGISHALATVEKLPLEIWNQVMNTNLTGTFLVTRAALPLMAAGSTIVNNLSVAAVRIFPGFAAYSASKAGALAFTNTLREELRKKSIRVLALLPGATDTEIWSQFWPEAPREKMVSPQTVAEAVLHAVSMPAGATIEEIRIGPVGGAL